MPLNCGDSMYGGDYLPPLTAEELRILGTPPSFFRPTPRYANPRVAVYRRSEARANDCFRMEVNAINRLGARERESALTDALEEIGRIIPNRMEFIRRLINHEMNAIEEEEEDEEWLEEWNRGMREIEREIEEGVYDYSRPRRRDVTRIRRRVSSYAVEEEEEEKDQEWLEEWNGGMKKIEREIEGGGYDYSRLRRREASRIRRRVSSNVPIHRRERSDSSQSESPARRSSTRTHKKSDAFKNVKKKAAKKAVGNETIPTEPRKRGRPRKTSLPQAQTVLIPPIVGSGRKCAQIAMRKMRNTE